MIEFVYPHTQLVAGVDEVGRGPLVGAVVTAAVILDPARPIAGLNDSKKLSEKRRLAPVSYTHLTVQSCAMCALIISKLSLPTFVNPPPWTVPR